VPDEAKPAVPWGLVIALSFAIGGAAVIAFVFVPALSPDTDPFWAFAGALVFMLIAMAAGYAARTQR
jgi:hypothetical protein